MLSGKDEKSVYQVLLPLFYNLSNYFFNCPYFLIIFTPLLLSVLLARYYSILWNQYLCSYLPFYSAWFIPLVLPIRLFFILMIEALPVWMAHLPECTSLREPETTKTNSWSSSTEEASVEETLSPQPSNPATSGASPNWEAPPTSPKNSVETVMEFFPPILIRTQASMIGWKYSSFIAMGPNIKNM